MIGSDREVVLRALELVGAALAAESEDAAIEVLRPDLEVLSREDLILVALALAVDIPRRRVPEAHRRKLAQRVEHARLEITWAGS